MRWTTDERVGAVRGTGPTAVRPVRSSERTMVDVADAARQHREQVLATGPRHDEADSGDSGARAVYRIVVDVLAVPEQVDPLVEVIGTAICGHPDDHPGPCRVAWRVTVEGPGRDGTVPPAQEQEALGALAALEVWPPDRATADLLAQGRQDERP